VTESGQPADSNTAIIEVGTILYGIVFPGIRHTAFRHDQFIAFASVLPLAIAGRL
jgi:hypothetical protein